MQATFSPTAARISAQLAELQRHALDEEAKRAGNESTTCASDSTEVDAEAASAVELKPFGYEWFLAVKSWVQEQGLEVPVASVLLTVVVACMVTSFIVIKFFGGDDPASLGYDRLMLRAACWLAQRVCFGWGYVLLSDRLEEAPFYLRKYDALGWPLWSTLCPAATQLLFFCPAALLLNAAIVHRSRKRYNTPATRRFYASLSREVHAAIVGCFLSDWCLFPTDLTFFFHHLLGLGIVFGVWSMILKEARLLAEGNEEPKTTISFWWITGLSIATMEGSSFFYCLYSLVSFGSILNLTLFAAYTYSHVLSITAVISQHPWGTSMKVIWWAGGHISDAIDGAHSRWSFLMCRCLPKGACVSMSYLYKSFMVAVICLARHCIMWGTIKEQTSGLAVGIVGVICALLALGCVWRLRDFHE